MTPVLSGLSTAPVVARERTEYRRSDKPGGAYTPAVGVCALRSIATSVSEVRLSQGDPCGRMITSAFFTALGTIDTSVTQAIRSNSVQQEEIDAQPCIAAPSISLVVPKRVHRLIGVAGPYGVDPTLIEQALKAGAALGL